MDQITNYYSKIRKDISDILLNIEGFQSNDKEINESINEIKEKLLENDKKFKKSLEDLEKNSEWDKFIVGFFGETNAGKSSIIEALRIIHNEKKRRENISKNIDEYVKSLKEYDSEFDKVLNDLGEFIKAIEEDDMKSTDKLQEFEDKLANIDASMMEKTEEIEKKLSDYNEDMNRKEAEIMENMNRKEIGIIENMNKKEAEIIEDNNNLKDNIKKIESLLEDINKKLENNDKKLKIIPIKIIIFSGIISILISIIFKFLI